MKNRVVSLALLITGNMGAVAIPAGIKILQDTPMFEQKMHGYNNCDMKKNGEGLVIKNFIKQGDVVFDVGANVGEWSKAVMTHAWPTVIFAFEPIPTIFNTLRTLETKVNLYNIAISDDIGQVEFQYYEKNAPLSGFYVREVVKLTPLKLKVNTIDLDTFCAQNKVDHIDFLKIDTEGAEWLVLQGAYGMLTNKAIKVIQFEYGGTYPDAKITLHQVYEYLTGLGYDIYRIVPEGLISIKQWRQSLEIFHYSNYLAVLRD